jgi:hypothetical protein
MRKKAAIGFAVSFAMTLAWLACLCVWLILRHWSD